eukprot:GHVU01078944.1.p1 GENE.GHVU01078944.1~~GHVU01078944.1.p1  ORF type:complete len:139 (-),score=13.00 GHVU01078944.1:191-586(-)
MAEEAVRNASADMITEAAELMGQVARRAEETGQRIRNFQRMGRYRGEVRNGRPHGLGVRRWDNGSVWYEGEWRNGNRHGLGVWRYTNGNIGYAGQWQDHRRHDLGVMRNDDGSVIHAGWWNRDSRSQTAPP